MIGMVVAHDSNRVIGNSRVNDMPWRIKGDLKYFKEITMGHTILMGLNTFKSIGRVLEGRNTAVLTWDNSFSHEGVQVYHTIEDAVESLEGDNIYVVGGGSIYEQMIDIADILYITEIDGEYEGDVTFPEYRHCFEMVSSTTYIQEGDYKYRFTIWKRI